MKLFSFLEQKTGGSCGQPRASSTRSPQWVGPPLPVCTHSLGGRGPFETIQIQCSMLLRTWLPLGTEEPNPGQNPPLV